MENIDKAVENALANLSIDDLNLTKEQIAIIKENLNNSGDVKELIEKSMIKEEEKKK